MSNKNFMTISKRECLKAYKQIVLNSDKQWESGKKLAAMGDYGGATSLSVISVEELIKSIIIFLDGKGFEFRSRTEGIQTLFKNHQIRHLIAYLIFVMGVMGDDLISFLEPFRKNPQELPKLIHETQTNPIEFEKKVQRYALRKMVLLRQEFIWFSKIDIFRQDGFYCDYDEQLKNPIDIGEDDYKGLHFRLEKVRKVGKGLIDSFNDQESALTEHVKKMKEDMITKNYYVFIGKALSKVRQTRGNPFEHIIKQFEQ